MRARASTREERQIAWLWGVAAVSIILLRPFWMAVVPYLPRCAFRAITGVPCPTCGSTRAGLALLDGHPLEAIALNPMAAAAGIAFLAGGFLAPVWATFKGPLIELPTPLPLAVRSLLVVVILAGWAYLIMTMR